MENRKLIYLFGSIFSVLFIIFYFFLFDAFINKGDENTTTVYFNQVGLYKNVENSEKTIANLKAENIEAYAINKEDVTAVVCGVSEDVATTKAMQDTLTSLSITFIEKEISFDAPEILTLWEQQEIIKVLEMMNY